MTHAKYITLLKQGAFSWNEWYKLRRATQLNLSGVDLNGVDLTGVDLSEANLRGAHLNGADLSRANLIGVDLSGTYLNDANLTEANLSRAEMRSADLRRTDLRKANLSFAHLVGADLIRANLCGALLSGADLDSTDLSEADLSEANLSFANLRGANLNHTNLHGSKVWSTIFAHLDLRDVQGLSEIYHQGSSHVELHTLQLPRDAAALQFLRGAGISDEWITFYMSIMPSHQYHSCFISYAYKDAILARRLHADLQDYGVRCWFAPEDLKIGDKIRPRIDEAIYLQEKLLLILSSASVSSDWVEHEVEMALAKERKEQRPVLFPIRVDRAILDQEDQGWPALVRHERHIGDFTNWSDPQAYQQAFERLLHDLKKADIYQDEKMKL